MLYQRARSKFNLASTSALIGCCLANLLMGGCHIELWGLIGQEYALKGKDLSSKNLTSLIIWPSIILIGTITRFHLNPYILKKITSRGSSRDGIYFFLKSIRFFLAIVFLLDVGLSHFLLGNLLT